MTLFGIKLKPVAHSLLGDVKAVRDMAVNDASSNHLVVGGDLDCWQGRGKMNRDDQ